MQKKNTEFVIVYVGALRLRKQRLGAASDYGIWRYYCGCGAISCIAR